MSCWWLPRRNWIRPSSPRSCICLTKRYSRLYTTVSIIMYTAPLCRCASTICRHSSTLVAAGTVLATCLPARSAAMACGAWSAMGELMWTASTMGSASSAS